QTWRTFLANHVRGLVALDFFTVPSARLRVLFVLVVLVHHRRRELSRFATISPVLPSGCSRPTPNAPHRSVVARRTCWPPLLSTVSSRSLASRESIGRRQLSGMRFWRRTGTRSEMGAGLITGLPVTDTTLSERLQSLEGGSR